jgi:hypothetical protein
VIFRRGKKGVVRPEVVAVIEDDVLCPSVEIEFLFLFISRHAVKACKKLLVLHFERFVGQHCHLFLKMQKKPNKKEGAKRARKKRP